MDFSHEQRRWACLEMVATSHLGVERLSSGAQLFHIRWGDMNIIASGSSVRV